MDSPTTARRAALWRRRPKTVVLCWIASALFLAVAGFIAGARSVVPGPASKDALLANEGERAAIDARIPRRDSLIVVFQANDVRTADFVEARESFYRSLGELRSPSGEPVFDRIETAGHSLAGDDLFVSSDNRRLLLRAVTVAPVYESEAELAPIPELVSKWRERFPSFRASYLSEGTANSEMFELIHRDLDRSLVFTLPLTFAVLVAVFRSIVAALVPLGVALVSLLASLGVTALISHISSPVSATASQLVVLLVLAIGVDYSLFMISRIREEARKGSSYPDAVGIANASTGVAVMWSGVTVALSLVGLFLMNDTVLTSMALVSIASVLITVAGAVGALPSLLLLVGPRIAREHRRESSGVDRGGAIAAWISLSVRRPVTVALIGIALTVPLALSAGMLELGTTVEPAAFPATLQSREAYEELRSGFPDMAGTDFSLIVRSSDRMDLGDDPRIGEVLDAISSHDTVRGPYSVDMSEDATVGRYDYVALGSGNDQANRNLIASLRDDLLPSYLSSPDARGYLGGTLPFVVEDVTRYTRRTPIAFGTVLLLSFVLLLVAFRSIVVPLKAILLNLLSTAVAFGVLALIFQHGPFEPWRYGVIESFVPPLLFSILFGLSMDYHVFLLARIREEVLGGAPTAEAVRLGITASSGTITGAAAIMVCVFAIIASLRLPIMKELGVGLAAAVLMDATLIRCALLPASMVLLGEANWYLPGWLRWLPRIDHESPSSRTHKEIFRMENQDEKLI